MSGGGAAAEGNPLFAPLPIIERRLEELCVGDPRTPTVLRDAMRYAALGGGKRLRPLLCWHACEAVGGPVAAMSAANRDGLLRACAAVEMVHAFSLVHDDLPALDNDDLRRGKPTLHKHAGEAMAILAGDALLTNAFLVLRGLPGNKGAAAVGELAEATWRMVCGQVLDTVGGFEDTAPPSERVREVHEQKTGALIACACRLGGLCGLPETLTDGERAALAAVTEYGRRLGLLFQITDDLLDVEQAPEQAGKRTGKDAGAGKLTYPGVLGPAGARAEVGRLRAEALAELRPLGGRGDILAGLCEQMCVRTR